MAAPSSQHARGQGGAVWGCEHSSLGNLGILSDMWHGSGKPCGTGSLASPLSGAFPIQFFLSPRCSQAPISEAVISHKYLSSPGEGFSLSSLQWLLKYTAS